MGEPLVRRADLRREADRPRGGDRQAGLHGGQSGGGPSGRPGRPLARRQRSVSVAGRTAAARDASTALLPARRRDARRARAAAYPSRRARTRRRGARGAARPGTRHRARARGRARAHRASRAGATRCARAVVARFPASVEPRRNLRPRVASRSKWARIEALLRNRAFVIEYASAREGWRDGVPAVFPPGTYWLQRFAAVRVLAT